MDIITQLSIITGFTLLGEFTAKLLPIPIPGSVLGLLFLYLSLMMKWVKIESIEKSGVWLKNNMAFFFIPLTVGLMESWELFSTILIPVLVIVFVSTTITLITSALITEHTLKKQALKEAEHDRDPRNTTL